MTHITLNWGLYRWLPSWLRTISTDQRPANQTAENQSRTHKRPTNLAGMTGYEIVTYMDIMATSVPSEITYD